MSTSKSPQILITGATGNIGTELSKQLAQQNVPFRAMVRSAEDAKKLNTFEGIEIVEGDFNDLPSLEKALQGIERAFLLTNSSEKAESLQSNFVEAAQRAGLPHLVKLSQWQADLHSPVRFLRYHAAIEDKVRQSGMAYTFLRPNLFMQGLLGFRQSIIEQGKFFAAVGDAKISTIDIRDIAAVAVAALTGKGHQNKTYPLTGPEALTHQQMADGLAKAMHQSVQFVDVSPEDMLGALLSAGFPDWQAQGLIEDYAHYARGEAATVTSDVATVTGHAPHSFERFAHDYADAFA